jgi:hypothetical protein
MMQLADEEPEAGPWRVEALSSVIEAIFRGRAGAATAGRPVILSVDGRSNSGKTTLAGRISRAVPGSAVVHTDDIAWEHSRFGWTDLLSHGILMPAREGQAVSFRPPRWAEHGRAGFIDVPAGCPLLVVEGVGAGRTAAAHLIDFLIWVQADEREAAHRGLARAARPSALDVVNMPVDGSPDANGWMAEEMPFTAAQRTWERADLIVCGTPRIRYDLVTELVVAPPLAPVG